MEAVAEATDRSRHDSELPSSPSSTLTEVPSSSAPVVPEEGNSNGSENEDTDYQLPPAQMQQQAARRSYRVNISISNIAPSGMRDDAWSCLAVLLTFWFFASMTLILGFYGSVNLELGPNCSRLIQTNPLLVQYIKMEELDELKPGPVLYSFYENPALDIEKRWTETHNAFIPTNFHKEWIHFLNEGSELGISYNVKSAMPLSLVIAKGRETLVEWIEDPSYPNTTLYWNIIHGTGSIRQEFHSSSAYYIAVGNLNSEEVEVELNFTVTARLYNTTLAYQKCSLGNPFCLLKLHLLRKNAAVLTSPGVEEGIANNNWYVKLSYGPRWITYFVGSGVMTILVMFVFRFCNMFPVSSEDGRAFQTEQIDTEERAPLLSHKDDDLSSWGSSYDSVSQSHDEEDLEEQLAISFIQGQAAVEGGSVANPRGLCAVCFDFPRDCFFLPCGHCAACYECGSRVAEEAGCCPICHRKMKKVRKIFTV